MKKSLPKPAKPAPQRRRRSESRTTSSFPVVGIGASAGGLEAMTQLLKHLPSHTGMSFVLVQHLDPTHDSALVSLLSRLTEMPVFEAKNNLPLLPDHFYVIPPNKLMGISERRLKLFPRSDDTHLAVDEFFCSLAEEVGNRAIGIILSGNGADGTQGCQAIKVAGGITFAQDEKSAKYPGMPGNAITAGCVDCVLKPEEIGIELARIAAHPYVAVQPYVAGQPYVRLGLADGEEVEPAKLPGAQAFADILMTLRQRTGVDFTHYKHATLKRRIQRRMVLHKFESLKEYADHIRDQPVEAKALFSDFLIHVTGFFRERAAFVALQKKLLPRLARSKSPDDPIRVWVPGCSTGEEVYSMAIVLAEFNTNHKRRNPVQIFGTDIHESTLEKARSGLYPESIKTSVSAERLRRFFVKVEKGYRINKSVRDLCIFARQNLVTDPPFSNLDLISCRNLLIYLGPVLQRKVMALFHYALKPNGYLMLGSSESVGSASDLFALQDRKAKTYLKKSALVRPFLPMGMVPADAPMVAGAAQPVVSSPSGPTLPDLQKQADRILLTHFSPAGVLINKHLEVLQFRGRTGPFLEHSHGEASLNLLKMAKESLLLDLRTLVTAAIKQNTRMRRSGIRIKHNDRALDVSIEVIPCSVPPFPDKFYLVLFDAAAGRELPVEKRARPGGKRVSRDATDLARLREELEATRESLQSIIEEQEATMEELRSANEEIMSSNEELQSTNEEMETTKEELQSTNEELTTLNDELESRNTEMEHINNDLHNVLGSVSIPMIILGPDLKIRRFTGMAEKLFNLIPSDVGRPVTDINLPLDIPELSKLVLEVIDHLSTKELETRDRSGNWWSVRIRPYKTHDNKIDGAVIALVDIDVIKESARGISEGRALASAMINALRGPALLLDQEMRVQAANQAFYRDFQVRAEETLGQRVESLGDGQWNLENLRKLLGDVLPGNSSFRNFEVEHNFPQLGQRRMKLEARRLSLKGGLQHLILLTIDDMTGQGLSDPGGDHPQVQSAAS